VIASLAIVAIVQGPGTFEVPPAPIAWSELDPAHFDRRWTLPEPPEGRDLAAKMRALAELTFSDGARALRLGDLVTEARGVDPPERDPWLMSLETRAPALVGEWREALWQLLRDDHLFSEKWRPSKDHPRDGILMAEGWEPAGEAGVWNELEPHFEQAAALFHVDMATIKRAENDYSTYPDRVGADYLEIHPVPGGHLYGEDEAGRPFRFVRIFFRSDLPFPFSSYACDLRILNRVDAEGLLHTDIYSPSPDFHYMAGRDVFLPVRDSADEIVAYLLVREFGFDVDDVPDRRRHRAEALRGALGNLKREAELGSRGAAAPYPTAGEALARMRVVGERAR